MKFGTDIHVHLRTLAWLYELLVLLLNYVLIKTRKNSRTNLLIVVCLAATFKPDKCEFVNVGYILD